MISAGISGINGISGFFFRVCTSDHYVILVISPAETGRTLCGRSYETVPGMVPGMVPVWLPHATFGTDGFGNLNGANCFGSSFGSRSSFGAFNSE